ncbi:MAG TPA: WD40 repeat domain-containing protein [Candidatus Dependentiae bacterium]|nr:WD40 repeat domain-containing protein [Candidatus Dependentiae bacterium]
MKKLFIAGLTCIIAITSVHVQTMEPPHKKLKLSLIQARHAGGVIESSKQLINLMQISKTTRNMAYDIIPHQKAPEIAENPEELVHFMRCDVQLCDQIFSMVQKKEKKEKKKKGFFPNIDQQTLEQVLDLSTQQPNEQLATLMGYSDNQLINIINATNYLDAEGLLKRGIRELARRALSNTHLDQLLKSEDFNKYYEQFDLPVEMDNAIAKHIKDHPIGKTLINRHIQQTKKPLHTFAGHTGCIRLVTISSNNQFVVTVGLEKIQIWNVESGECIHTSDGEWIDSVTFSSDNRFVIARSGDKKVQIWSVKIGQCVCPLDHVDFVNSGAISSNNQFKASVSKDGAVQIWSVKTGRRVRTLNGHGGVVDSAVISSDNQFVVTAGGLVARIFNVKTDQHIQAFYHKIRVYSVSISLDNRFVATGSWDGNVRIWQFIDPEFNSAMRNLALKDAQVIVALMTNKITLKTMPQHLREIYDGMPDVLQSLFTQ